MLVVEVQPHTFEPFSRDTLFISIFQSLQHRSTALDDATQLTKTVLAQILKSASGSITLQDINAITAEILERFDKVAGVYYRAYHPL